MASRLRKKQTGWGARVRFGENLARDEWIPLDVPHDDEPRARDRLARLQALAKRMSAIGQHVAARKVLEEAGATRHERGFHAIEQMVAEMSPELQAPRQRQTFRDVVRDLSDGTLHEQYPEEVEFKTPTSLAQTRAKLAVFLPVLGDKTFEELTREDIQEAKRCVPKGLKLNTRARYLRELRRVLRLAVEPLGLCEKTPTLSVPSGQPGGVFQLLYPIEEAQLCACVEIPIERRFLYAFMARNGGRISETLKYTFQCIDDDGVIHVEKSWTKTKRARYWPLAPDVLEAVRLRRAQMPEDATHMFVLPPPTARTRLKKINRQYVLRMLLIDLKTAGINRQGLITAIDGERKLCVHDVRASFVTLARAAGLTDRWIMDRSGHESAAVFEKYDRGVRHAREIHLGWWAPMGLALGLPGAKCLATAVDAALMVKAGPGSGQGRANGHKYAVNGAVLTIQHGMSEGAPHPLNSANSGGEGRPNAADAPLGPAEKSISGQSSTPPEASDSPVEQALAAALDGARAREQWDVALAIVQELAERRRARLAVPSLADARRKRDERGGGK